MTSDSHLFRTREQLEVEGWRLVGNVFERQGERYLPLYEQNMIHLDNHRFASFRLSSGTISINKSEYLSQERLANISELAISRYWIHEKEVGSAKKNMESQAGYYLAFRRSVRSTDARTVLFCALPDVAAGDSIFLILPPSSNGGLLLAGLGAFVFDFVARQSIGGENTSFFIMKQLPILPPTTYTKLCPWSNNSETLRDWLLPRILELTYTAWDLEPFARDCVAEIGNREIGNSEEGISTYIRQFVPEGTGPNSPYAPT